jgi:hypothetical protein
MGNAGVVSHPFTYWVGMDTDPRTSPADLAEFNRFYSTTHVHEVIAAHPGFLSASRYELVDPEPRDGTRSGPRWLAVYGMADEAAAVQYLKDNARPWLHRRRYSPWPAARKRAKTVWRMIWRQLPSTGPTAQPSGPILIVGTNTATQSGTRLELYRSFAPPEPGCPRFCTIYEPDAAVETAEAVWRLVYRPIPAPE